MNAESDEAWAGILGNSHAEVEQKGYTQASIGISKGMAREVEGKLRNWDIIELRKREWYKEWSPGPSCPGQVY